MITFTDKATQKLTTIQRDDWDGSHMYVRLGVKGGGCAGFQNSIEIDDKGPTEFDETGQITDTITWIIDPLSMQYLEGTTIDYVATLMQEGFSFSNSRISARCGCGSSVVYE